MKAVTTTTAQKTKKHEINRGRRNYVREQTSASREPVAVSYTHLDVYKRQVLHWGSVPEIFYS